MDFKVSILTFRPNFSLTKNNQIVRSHKRGTKQVSACEMGLLSWCGRIGGELPQVKSGCQMVYLREVTVSFHQLLLLTTVLRFFFSMTVNPPYRQSFLY